MEIRMLNMPEILPALRLAWEVFAEEIAPTYKPEGVESFRRFITYDYISQVWQRGNLVFFGAYEGEEMCGMLAVRPDGHIALFFVKKQWQGKGVGRMLFQAACFLCRNQLRVGRMTVNAAPKAVEKYMHMGMHAVSDVCETDGMVYVPMEMSVNDGMPVQKKSSKAPWIALGGYAVFLLFILIICAAIVKDEFRTELRDRNSMYDYGDDYDGDWPPYESGNEDSDDGIDSDEDDVLSGAGGIPEYIAEDLPYEIEDDEYVFSGEAMESAFVEFNVIYPKVTGLADAETEKAINESLKNIAKETVARIYENPSPEIKERVLSEDTPLLIDYVDYKVCFASEDILSVVYDDNAYEGGQNYYAQHLRTCNINMKDGTVYEVKDIIKLNDAFIENWLVRMRQEAGKQEFLSELDLESMKKALEGDSQDGVYEVNFFLDENGIEIGFDLNYKADDPNDLKFVWVTAPFSFDEIEEYAADNDFWKYVRK